jgi:flagellar motility protein MotE (MotC chaperone)
MSDNGYDKFFREAQKKAGLTDGNPKAKPKFTLKGTGTAAPKKQKRSGSPEDRLRQELTERMSQRKKLVAGRKKSLPVYPVLCTVAALVMCAVAYMKSDVVDEWLSKIEVSALGQASAAENEKPTNAKSGAAKPSAAAKEEKSAATTGAKSEKAAETSATEKPAEVTSTKGWTTEELSFFSKLNDRKKELDLREAELGKLEEELQKRKAELDEKLKSLEAMRTDISKTLKTRVAEDSSKVDKLVSVYSSMKAQQAAKVIESLNEDLAVEILDKMKKKSAAEILDAMTAKKARRLSELLTGYQRSTASVGAEDGAAEAPAKTTK